MQLIAKLTRIVGSAEIERQGAVTSWLPEEPELAAEDVDDLEGNIKGTKRGEVSLKKRQQALENDQVTLHQSTTIVLTWTPGQETKEETSLPQGIRSRESRTYA